jgi:hypothetical protein
MEINKTQVEQFNRMRETLLIISTQLLTPKELKVQAKSNVEYKKNLEKAYSSILKHAKVAALYVRPVLEPPANKPGRPYKLTSSPSNTSHNEHR